MPHAAYSMKISFVFVHSHSARFTTQSKFLYNTQVKSNFQKVMLLFMDFLRISFFLEYFLENSLLSEYFFSCDTKIQNIFWYCYVSGKVAPEDEESVSRSAGDGMSGGAFPFLLFPFGLLEV
jgi:hypothetical protein